MKKYVVFQVSKMIYSNDHYNRNGVVHFIQHCKYYYKTYVLYVIYIPSDLLIIHGPLPESVKTNYLLKWVIKPIFRP